MSTEYTYYIKVLEDKALLILEKDYEDTSAFATGEDDSLTYSLEQTVDLPTYEKLIKTDDKWINARVVDKDHIFKEVVSGDWCNYTYQTEGCGYTTKTNEYTFI